MPWFRKKPSWEEQYAQNIYGALVASNDLGDITARKLRIPTVLHHALTKGACHEEATTRYSRPLRLFDGF